MDLYTLQQSAGGISYIVGADVGAFCPDYQDYASYRHLTYVRPHTHYHSHLFCVTGHVCHIVYLLEFQM